MFPVEVVELVPSVPSHGGLEHRDVGAPNQVLILPVDQRVPLIKVLLQPCKTQNDSELGGGRTGAAPAASFLPRWRCRKASVALLQRSMATSGSISPFSFISLPIQLPVRKVKSGKLWWTVPLPGETWPAGQDAAHFYGSNEEPAQPAVYLMVIIFRCKPVEYSFFMRLMFPAHWNFSELMKKRGCFTWISSSKGNIQESSATPHLTEERSPSWLTA